MHTPGFNVVDTQLIRNVLGSGEKRYLWRGRFRTRCPCRLELLAERNRTDGDTLHQLARRVALHFRRLVVAIAKSKNGNGGSSQHQFERLADKLASILSCHSRFAL